MVKEALFS